MDYRKTIKNLLSENISSPDIFSYITALSEILFSFRPSTLREKRNLEISIQHLKEIRKMSKKIVEENKNLQEQIKILEEGKNDE